MADQNRRDTNLSHLHPTFRRRVESVQADLEREQIPFRLFEGFRSPDRQTYLYAQGRTREGSVVTNAEAWESLHQYGVAADFVLYLADGWSWDDRGTRARWWSRLHEIGRQYGLEPLRSERPHLQLAELSLRDLKAGRYPPGGDDAWAENLEAAIIGWRGSPAAPHVPAEAVARPPIE